MKRAYSILASVASVALLACGCAYFRPSQTEAERFQEQQSVRKDEYLKGTIFDGLAQAAGSALNH